MSEKELNDDVIRREQLHTNSMEDHVRERIYSHVVWTPSEELYRKRSMCFCGRTVDPKDVPPTKFTAVLNRKVRYSFIGCFLKELNTSQREEKEVQEHKLRMLEFDWNCRWDDTIYLDNDLCNDVLGLIREAAGKSQGAIGRQEVLLLLDNIRLVDCMITDIDEDIKNLRNLKALFLAANRITTLNGGHLPSSLEFLDLYGNFISDITSLSCDLPEWLLHLGLGRNRLSDNSALHLLAGNGTSNLRSVDLEDNNLYDLAAVLRTMTELRHLVALHLKGNPCSVQCCTLSEEIKDITNNPIARLIRGINNTLQCSKSLVLRF